MRPDKPKDRLFDEAGLLQNERDHHRFGFQMIADLRIARTDVGPVVMVRDAVDRNRARITQFRPPVDRSEELQQPELRVCYL